MQDFYNNDWVFDIRTMTMVKKTFRQKVRDKLFDLQVIIGLVWVNKLTGELLSLTDALRPSTLFYLRPSEWERYIPEPFDPSEEDFVV